ncbi:MAG: hypothetical protein KatS3mg065_1119 [Chloroflexota bacterium]|nr:MAG: hypothetical protein KatS3mg065_1119 [Chloroflexota bacterium]
MALLPLGPGLLRPVRLTRLNQAYGPIVALCRTYLEARGVEADGSDLRARAVLFPMGKVFESAIANHLRLRMGSAVKVQEESRLPPSAGGPDHPLTYVPDLRIELKGQRLILDTKYKDPERATPYGTAAFRNEDLYQIAFYASAHGCSGYLVYPRVERDVAVTYQVGGVQFGILTVNLEAPGLGGLEDLHGALVRLLHEQRSGEPVNRGSPSPLPRGPVSASPSSAVESA